MRLVVYPIVYRVRNTSQVVRRISELSTIVTPWHLEIDGSIWDPAPIFMGELLTEGVYALRLNMPGFFTSRVVRLPECRFKFHNPILSNGTYLVCKKIGLKKKTALSQRYILEMDPTLLRKMCEYFVNQILNVWYIYLHLP